MEFDGNCPDPTEPISIAPKKLRFSAFNVNFEQVDIIKTGKINNSFNRHAASTCSAIFSGRQLANCGDAISAGLLIYRQYLFSPPDGRLQNLAAPGLNQTTQISLHYCIASRVRLNSKNATGGIKGSKI